MSEKRPGRPRQRAQGSRRRYPHDADAEVGESPWGRHTEKASSEKSGEAFSFGFSCPVGSRLVRNSSTGENVVALLEQSVRG